MKYEVKANKTPDFEDLKIEETTIQQYSGSILKIKFREGSKKAKMVGSDWIEAAKQVAIPIEDKIYVIWGNEEKFPILMKIILKMN